MLLADDHPAVLKATNRLLKPQFIFSGAEVVDASRVDDRWAEKVKQIYHRLEGVIDFMSDGRRHAACRRNLFCL